mgnify:FL=1|tara:strand:- start:731 stop:1237 length:507 start_codon:yes stop_codon:yes gene_type:complete
MIEFDYDLDYKNTLFKPNDPRYRIGRGEQGVLLVRPYTDVICKHWRFKTPKIAQESAVKIYNLYNSYKEKKDFVGMDMCRKFLEMGFTRARRYANHRSGRKYDSEGNVRPQEKDALTNKKAESAKIFRYYRKSLTSDPTYIIMRKEWRRNEHILFTRESNPECQVASG